MLPSELAASITALLTPFAPYLIEGGKKFASKAGEAAWAVAERLWTSILGSTSASNNLHKQALAFVASPSNESVRRKFELTLLQNLIEHPELAIALTEIIQSELGTQDVIAKDESLVEHASQDMSGAGSQSIEASGRAKIKGVKQSKR